MDWWRVFAGSLVVALLARAEAGECRVVDARGLPVAHVRVDRGDGMAYSDSRGRVFFPYDGVSRLPSEEGFGPDDLVLRGRRLIRGRITSEVPDRLVVHLDLGQARNSFQYDYIPSVRKFETRPGEPFELRALRPAMYRVRVESGHHVTRDQEVNLIRRNQEIEWELTRGARVEGRIRFDSVGFPARPRDLQIGYPWIFFDVDEDGRFALPLLPPRSIKFLVRWGRIDPGSDRWLHHRVFERALQIPRTTLDYVVRVRELPRLRVRFRLPDDVPGPVDADLSVNGAQLRAPYWEPLKVRLEKHSRELTLVTLLRTGTGEDLRCPIKRPHLVLRDLQPGLGRLLAESFGLRADSPRFVAGETTDLEIEFQRLRGRPILFTGDTGSVTLWGFGNHGRLTPDQPLGFLKAVPRPRRTRVLLLWRSDRHLPQLREIEVQPDDEPLRVDFPKVPAPKLRIRVVSAEGMPSTGHAIRIGPPEYVNRSAWSGGRFPDELISGGAMRGRVLELECLPPGHYAAVVDGVQLARFDLAPAGTDLTIRLPK